ncbi:hypothetical protein [Actinoplanes sp. RD1]|uniref:hypothetical protein n=1 Tax=Actinoplanes sp. RD1 TaxID=3064538 RepID=UPI00274131C8|nr:hypothetical protein [Actinoplanes sp. RD1]
MLRVPTSRTGRAVLISMGAVAAAGAVAALTALGGGQLGALLLSLIVVGVAFLTRRPAAATAFAAGDRAGRPAVAEGVAGARETNGTDGSQS